MQWLKADTETVVRIGSFMDKDDGVTPEVGIDLSTADQAEIIKHGGTTGVSIAGNTWAGVGGTSGWYALTLTAGNLDTEGLLEVIVQDESVCLPVVCRFMVLSAQVWDSMVDGSDLLQTDMQELDGGTQSAADLKDFADEGYNPATNKVTGVLLTDTCTTNTDLVSAASVRTEMDSNSTELGKIGTIPALDGGAQTIGAAIGKLADDNGGATFDAETDSLNKIRDDGDVNWVTGAAGSGLSPLASGTAQSGTASTIVLASAATFADDELNGNIVKIHTGTGSGQARLIISNTLADDTCNVYPNWTTNPASDSEYEIVEGTMNIGAVSLDGIAADNLELQYDTTGLSGDTFPATQAAVGNLTSGSAAINTTAKNSPDGFVITVGTNEANNEDSTHALDGAVHSLDDDGADDTDAYYIFDVGVTGVPVSVTWHGYAQSNGDSYAVYAKNWPSTWEQIGTISGSNGTTVVTDTFGLTNAHVGTGANVGLVHFRFLSDDGVSFATDRITCSYAVVNQSVGYADGAIWVDSAGTAGAENYVNGTADNPCPWANALTISTSLGIKRFHIASGNTVTLDDDSDNFTLYGMGWTLALGTQSIEGVFIEGASVSGTGTATVTPPRFEKCGFGAVTLPPSILRWCGIGAASGQFTAGSAGQYFIVDCVSMVPGSGSPVFDFSGLGATTGINNRRWSGGSTYTLDSDCTLSHEVVVGGGTTITTGGGDAEIRGITRSLTVTMSAAETVQFVGTTGPITLNGTTTATVNLHGVSTSVTDNTSAATVNDSTVKGPTINEILVDTGTTIPGTITTAQNDLDIITGTDGTTLATSQGNYAPSKAGDDMNLADNAIEAGKYDESTAFPLAKADSGSDEIARTGADSDTLETLSDQIDGLSGTSILTTTIATLATQLSFTLTAGSADDDAYNGCYAVVTDQSTAVQKAIGIVSNYTGATKTITLIQDPGIFTMATGDSISIMVSHIGRMIIDDSGDIQYTTNALERAPSGTGSDKFEVRGDVTQMESGEVRWVVWCEKNGQPETPSDCTVSLVACDGDGTSTPYAGATETVATADAYKTMNGGIVDPGFTVGTQDFLFASLTADGDTRTGFIPFKTPARLV